MGSVRGRSRVERMEETRVSIEAMEERQPIYTGVGGASAWLPS
jgi:hypothetical protein